jgi:hypothetical protein
VSDARNPLIEQIVAAAQKLVLTSIGLLTGIIASLSRTVAAIMALILLLFPLFNNYRSEASTVICGNIIAMLNSTVFASSGCLLIKK